MPAGSLQKKQRSNAVVWLRAELTFFGVLTRLYVLFSSSAQRWEILKKHVELSIKSERLGSHFHRKKRWFVHQKCQHFGSSAWFVFLILAEELVC